MEINDYMSAIRAIESSGGNYNAVGPVTASGNRAYGADQVMDFNVGPWTEKWFGKRLTPAEFLENTKAQDAVFKGQFGSYLERFGNAQDAASMWFTGKPLAQGAGRKDILGTTGEDYVNKFNTALGDLRNNGMDGKPTGILGAMAGQQEEETPFYKDDRFANVMDSLIVGLNSMRLNPDENIARMAQNRMAQRRQKRETNRTIQWMRANGYGQYADMVESGQIPAKTMMTTLLAKRLEGPAKPIEVGGRLIDPNTYEVVYSPQEGPDFEIEQKLRKEFAALPAIDQLANQTTAYEKILKSAENPSPAGDLALVFNYMKVLDPSSVVRESEFKSAAMAGNFGQRIQAAVGNIEKGTLLTADQRRDFIDRATRLYQGGVAQAQPFYDQYSQYAQKYGIDPSRILTQFSYAGQMPELLPNVPREIPQSAIDAGLTQNDWDELSVLGKSAFVEK